MRQFLVFLILPLFVISCDTVVFDNPQPVGENPLSDIDRQYSGIYVSSDNDTLVISSRGISLQNEGKENRAILGSNAILKPYKNGYVLSVVDSSQYGLFWVCFQMQLRSDSLYIHFADYGDLEKVEKDFGSLVANKVYCNTDGKRVKMAFSPKNSSGFEELVNAGLFNKRVSFALVKQ